MVLQKLGNIRKPVIIRVEEYQGDLHYHSAEPLKPGRQNGPTQFVPIARISEKELEIAGVNIKNDNEENETESENILPQKPEQIRSLAELEESNEEAFNNQFSYEPYNKFRADVTESDRIQSKTTRQGGLDASAKAAATKGEKKAGRANSAKDVVRNRKKGKGGVLGA
jgi:hypothetical protein